MYNFDRLGMERPWWYEDAACVIGWLVSRHRIGFSWYTDDLEGWLWLKAIETMPRHDPKQASAKTFLANRLRGEAMDRVGSEAYPFYIDPKLLRQHSGQMQDHFAYHFPLCHDATMGHDRRDLDKAVACLPPRDQRFVEMLVEGYRLKDIAKYFGLTETWACRERQRIIRVLKNYMREG